MIHVTQTSTGFPTAQLYILFVASFFESSCRGGQLCVLPRRPLLHLLSLSLYLPLSYGPIFLPIIIIIISFFFISSGQTQSTFMCHYNLPAPLGSSSFFFFIFFRE
uniref:Ovule protein n=1 Tax=Caenorhabditis tropicalis TaxID=1561998 RepID=A0A1I7T3Z7_9PELO